MNADDPRNSIIGDWLYSIKMGDYTTVFRDAGYESPYQLKGIGDEDLLKMGVRLIGHRNKILKAVRALEAATDFGNTLSRAESITV